ncbi:MAG: GNAT family N-acetyltransferase [Alphaproteobacteria bacterium]
MATTGAEGERASELATARLILRPLMLEDWREVHELAGDDEVARWTASLPHPMTEQDARRWVESRTHVITPTGIGHVFAVTRRDDGCLVGVAGFYVRSGTSSADLGYWFGRAYWNRGYAAEALVAMLRFAFEGLHVAEAKATAFPDNIASMRVLEKAGFRVTGRTNRDIPLRGGVREIVLCAVDKAAFFVAGQGK